MGVDRSDWILIGANIGYSQYDSDKYEEYDEFAEQDDFGAITYLIDGMGGEYFIVGAVLAVDKDDRGLNFDLSTISKEQLQDLKLSVYDFIADKFGIGIEPSLIIKTHWT